MLDVEVKQEIIALLNGGQSRTVENVFPFRVAENGIVTVNLRSDNQGVLELQAIEGGAIYLFEGGQTAKQALQALEESEPFFSLAAAIGAPAVSKITEGSNQVTLFSKKTSLGFIRTCQYV